MLTRMTRPYTEGGEATCRGVQRTAERRRAPDAAGRAGPVPGGHREGAGTQDQGLGGRKPRRGHPALPGLSVRKQDGGCHRGRPPRVSGCGGPHRPAGGVSFAVGQDVVRRGGSCKGERRHGLDTILPVPSAPHGDEPPRDRQVSSTTASPRERPGGFLSGLPASAAPPQTPRHSGDHARLADVPALASRTHCDTLVAPSLYLSRLPAAPPRPPQHRCPSRGQDWRWTGRPGRGRGRGAIITGHLPSRTAPRAPRRHLCRPLAAEASRKGVLPLQDQKHLLVPS